MELNYRRRFFELVDGIDGSQIKKELNLQVDRAEKNYNKFDHKNPAREESSTTVFLLTRKH
ncbi:MAG: hypothetical protein NZ529_02290 [Cytophagaceae bacterium]|nr:hypothetical protein [Cytophagaceae bacterium]MDW8455598.1 hypothetical protein [Cytophagaceae bacterium]